jgi:hypothetical protein
MVEDDLLEYGTIDSYWSIKDTGQHFLVSRCLIDQKGPGADNKAQILLGSTP